jgi:cation transport ATPase
LQYRIQLAARGELEEGRMATATNGSVQSIEVFRHTAHTNPDELLRLAASLDQASRHELAPTLVNAARERGLVLSAPTDVIEDAAYGIRGCVDGRSVSLGTSYWVDRTNSAINEVRRVQSKAARSGCANVFIAIDGVTSGAILLETSGGWPMTSWTARPWGFYA